MEFKPDFELLKKALPDIKIIRFVAMGGYKAVYEAIINGSKEALKLAYIPREDDRSEEVPETLLRIKREIESLNRCKCPYLVKLGSLQPQKYTIGSRDYIVYSEEFLEGKSLSEFIKEGFKPTYDQCKRLLLCFLHVIKELKMNKLIHRDIKPANVLALDDPDRPYVVLDLGIAFKLDSTTITRNPDIRMGTLPYMPPEAFDVNFHQQIDFRSDLYSAALTTYEYASGINPFVQGSRNDPTTLPRITSIIPKPLITYRPDFPEAFCQIIDQLMKRIPALRPSNIEGLIKKMEAL
jgi:serine/threonine-protein kinase